MPLQIIRDNIIKVKADAIVNTANPKVAIGEGVDGVIYNAAGRDELLKERKKIGELRPGQAAVTPAFKLNAKYIIHTVGPAWTGGKDGELETVAECYRNSLLQAKELGCESIAFPLISTGTYGFPKDVALKTAVSEISTFLFENEMTVYLVVYDRDSFDVSGKVFTDIKSFIHDNEVVLSKGRNTLSKLGSGIFLNQDPFATLFQGEEYAAKGSIEDIIKIKEETFQQHLFRIIDRKGLSDPEIYKKANLDRKHFSKIRSNIDYNPSKKTAVALAIALELNWDETKDLLLKAGIALSRSSIFDLIIEYCINNGIKDIHKINCYLFDYDQQLLGA